MKLLIKVKELTNYNKINHMNLIYFLLNLNIFMIVNK